MPHILWDEPHSTGEINSINNRSLSKEYEMVTGYMPLLSYITVATGCRQDRKLGVYIRFENPI
jgi:hypothetical protein